MHWCFLPAHNKLLGTIWLYFGIILACFFDRFHYCTPVIPDISQKTLESFSFQADGKSFVISLKRWICAASLFDFFPIINALKDIFSAYKLFQGFHRKLQINQRPFIWLNHRPHRVTAKFTAKFFEIQIILGSTVVLSMVANLFSFICTQKFQGLKE